MRNLKQMFVPNSVAVIGASRDPGSVGAGVLRNLNRGGFFHTKDCRPFHGKIYPINPHAAELQGMKCYPSVLQVPGPIDLAIFCIPAKIIPGVMKECIQKKIRQAIIISSGFGEFGDEGKRLQQELEHLCKGKVNVVGPNCLGILRPSSRLNASFAVTMPPKGSIGFITQSGALADSIIDWAVAERYGFSTIISYGNAMDLEVSDYLEYLGKDKETKAITLYIEGLRDGKRFMEVAKRVSKIKPIIAIKAGRTAEGTKAISSHTGSLAGSYAVYEAAFRQSGITMVDTVEELFDTAKALAEQPPCENGIAIVTNGGGCGVLTADYCGLLGVHVVSFTEQTLQKLDVTGKMHPAYSRRNPLDLVGDALPERYELALDIVLGAAYVHGAIVIQTLQTMTDSVEDAKIVVKMRKLFPKKPIICVYMGGKFSMHGIRYLEEHGIPDFNDPRKAALAMKALIERYQQLKNK